MGEVAGDRCEREECVRVDRRGREEEEVEEAGGEASGKASRREEPGGTLGVDMEEERREEERERREGDGVRATSRASPASERKNRRDGRHRSRHSRRSVAMRNSRYRMRRRGRGRKRGREHEPTSPVKNESHEAGIREESEHKSEEAPRTTVKGEGHKDNDTVEVGGKHVRRITPVVHYKAGEEDIHYYRSGRYFQTDPTAEFRGREVTAAEHIRLARAVVHPNEAEAKLPTTLQLAIRTGAEEELRLADKRKEICKELTRVSEALEPLRKQWAKRLPGCCQRLNLPLMYYLAKVTSYPDIGCIEELRDEGGLAFMGAIEAKGIFAPRRTNGYTRNAAAMTPEECRDVARKRAKELESDVKDTTEEEKWLWEQAEKEVTQGRLEGPYELSQLAQWEKIGATRRHVVVQPGKLRPCDDYRRSQVNKLMHIEHKVTLPELETTIAVVKEVWRAHKRAVPLSIWKRDHRDAYRQVPLKASERGWTTVLLRDPTDGKIRGFCHRVFPFGAVSSVTGYLRIGMMVSHFMRVLLACGVQSYLDDYYVIEPKAVAPSSFEAFGRVNELLGLVVKQEKDIGPSEVAKVLGIEVDVKTAGTVSFRIDDERRGKLMEAVGRAIREGLPGGSAGRKLAGRLSFACSVLRGRCGRAYVRTIIRGTYGVAEREEITAALRGVARLIGTAQQGSCGRGVDFATAIVPRDEPRKHVVVYADATGDGAIAAVATAADGRKVWYSKGHVPEWFKLQLSERENQVMAYELYAVAAALETYGVDPKRSYLVCTDSEVVRTMVSRGSGKPADMNAVVGRMWDRLASGLVSVYFCRVASEANPADGPSRGLPVSRHWEEVPWRTPSYLL